MRQYDYNPSFDISSLPSISQSQLQNLVAQIAPLANIGGIIFQAATSAAVTILASTSATTGCPDVANNPRFSRYLWLNSYTTPATPYFYNPNTGNWQIISVAASAIVTASLASPISAPNGVPLSLLKGNAAYTDEGKAGYVVRVAADGLAIEAVNLATFLATEGNLALANIQTTGAAENKVICRIGGVTVWGAPALDDLAANNGNPLSITNLAPGTSKYILRTSGANVEWCDRASDDLFAAATFTLDKLAIKNTAVAGNSNQYQVPTINGSGGLEFATPMITRASGAILDNAVLPVVPSGTSRTLNHGLGTIPPIWKVVIKNTSGITDQGYPANAELDIMNVVDGVGGFHVFDTYATSADIKVVVRPQTSYTVLKADGTAAVNLTAASWTLKAYCFL